MLLFVTKVVLKRLKTLFAEGGYMVNLLYQPCLWIGCMPTKPKGAMIG